MTFVFSSSRVSIFLSLVLFVCLQASAQQVTRFTIPTADANPWDIATAPDGAVWFSELDGNKVGKLTRDGKLTEYQLPIPLSRPQGIVVTSDGSAWFAESNSARIGRISPSGQLTEFPTSTNPYGLCLSPSGGIYFTEYQLNRIGRLTSDGEVVEFSLGWPLQSGPWACAADSDGNIWYTALISNAIGKLSPSGAVIEFRLPAVGVPRRPQAITVGADGNVWFVDWSARRVARMTPAGMFSEFQTTAAPNDIVVGNGYLWFTQSNLSETGNVVESGSIVRIDYDGHMTEYSIDGNPIGIATDAGIWVTLLPDKVAHFAWAPRRRAVKH